MTARVAAVFLVAAAVAAYAAGARSTGGARGAHVPFVEYEAESASTDGTLIGPGRTFGTLASEASGRRAVRLRAGQYVEFKLSAPANAVDIRYSIPDAPRGGGRTATLAIDVDGVHTRDLTLTSAYSWLYGGYPFSNDPKDGLAHFFYDDVRTMLPAPAPAGSSIRLRATADTVVDLADFELVPPPLPRPAGSLAVTEFGADPTGTTDSGPSFDAAIAAGRVQRRVVWIPPGTYTVDEHVMVDDVTLDGAGPWYSILHGAGVGVYGNPAPRPSTNVHLGDFAIFGEVRDRNDNAQLNGIGGALAGGSVISNLWIQHTKVGVWLDGPFDGLHITGLRILDTTADGLNLHQGIRHATVEDTYVRNTGDDGLAMWSDAGLGGEPNRDDAFRFDTVALPILANGIALYGGRDNAVTDSVVSDTVTEGGGLHVGNRFSSSPLAGTTVLARNTLLRAGSYHPGLRTPIGALWFYAKDEPMTGRIDVRDTVIVDSSYAAVQFYGSSVRNVTLTSDRLDRPRTFAAQIQSNGRATFSGVSVTKPGHRGVYHCRAANAFTLTARNSNNLSPPYCGPFPRPRLG